MKQPWINKHKTDIAFILFPQFFVLGIVFFCQDFLKRAEENHSFFTWLLLIVFIDVAHVYATLFKTYFVKEEFEKRKKLLLLLPLFCFLYRIPVIPVWSKGFLVGFGLCSRISFYSPAIWIHAALFPYGTQDQMDCVFRQPIHLYGNRLSNDLFGL